MKLTRLVLFVIIVIIMGCSMGTKLGNPKESDFKKTALEIIELYKISIEFVGYPYDEMEKYEYFYSTTYGEKEEEIKKRIMSLHYDFFAAANFKDRNDPSNKLLAEQLIPEYFSYCGFLFAGTVASNKTPPSAE